LFPAHTEPGDDIWILAGGRTPYTVRHRKHANVFLSFTSLVSSTMRDRLPPSFSNDADECCTLAGETYVHGIMYGELMEGDPKVVDVHLR
jgi:hypothetical protein